MRRGVLAVVLVLGAVFGFASGIHHLHHGSGGWGREWCGGEGRGSNGQDGWNGHERFEKHVAEICADAAVRARPASGPVQ